MNINTYRPQKTLPPCSYRAMTTNLIIFVSALCFFAIQETKPRFHFWNKAPSIRPYLAGLPKPTEPAKRMWIAIVSGERRVLKKEEKELFLRLGVTHIFTPSGLHLSTLTFFMSKGRIFKFATFIIGSLMGSFGLFPAMTRVLFLKSASRGLPFFCLIMLIEGALFSWSTHYLSWICSWMFLGFCYFSPKSHRALWFALGQMLLCHVFFQQWSPLGIVINLFMMMLMQILFPALLLTSLIPAIPQGLPLWALQATYKVLSVIDSAHQNLTLFIPHAGHLLFFLLWIMLIGRKRFVLPLVLLLLSAPLNQQKMKSFSNSKWEGSDVRGMKCKSEWRNQRWEERCRPLKRERHTEASLLSLKR